MVLVLPSFTFLGGTMSDPFPRPGLVFILGIPGSRKTWLGLNLALRAATTSRPAGSRPAGSRWLGLPLPSTPSLFIDYEGGEATLWHRVRSMVLSARASKTTPFYFAYQSELDLQSLVNTARDQQLGFIVLDSPFGITSFKTTADVIDRAASLRALNDIAEQLQATLVVLLHTHQRRTSIGSILLAAGVQHVLALDAPFGQPLVHLRTINALPGIAPLSITAPGPFTPYKRPRHLGQYPPVSPIGPAGRQLLTYLTNHGLSSTADLQQNSTSTPVRVRNLIKELVKDGYVRRANPGAGGTPASYQLTPAGSGLLSSWHARVV